MLAGCADTGRIQPMNSAKNSVKKPANRLNLSKYPGTSVGGDCSGLVSVINARHGGIFFDEKELGKYFTNGRKSQAIFNLYKSRSKIVFTAPKTGYLIFFKDTTAQTKNKKAGKITHIGVVYDVLSDGSVIFLHNNGSGKNRLATMNLRYKNYAKVGNKKVNDYLIARCNSPQCLTSHHFAGYGKIE